MGADPSKLPSANDWHRILEEYFARPITAHSDQVARLVRLLWGGSETIFVISSDLSHYQRYERARAIDQQTAEFIVQLEHKSLGETRACGFRAIAGALQVARERSLQCMKLDLRNSGDTGGSKDRVVGYGAFAFFE